MFQCTHAHTDMNAHTDTHAHTGTHTYTHGPVLYLRIYTLLVVQLPLATVTPGNQANH